MNSGGREMNGRTRNILKNRFIANI
ncbi:hypothetical protein NC652_020458 [Populus alba x Populus x berolinensis]|nr:hypothetical protein NC651_019718 [Populus alba x Populus x berolinensis]KAJ6902020.1 hypothetical protein NC651_019721 [Populus alba x Populus x berolinensis]KAJ6909481.1 hypothetical protein NC652_020458 [Populus alba x Populus x berolinensis]